MGEGSAKALSRPSHAPCMPPGRPKPKGKRPAQAPSGGKHKGKKAPAASAAEPEEYEPQDEDRAWFKSMAGAGGFLANLQAESLEPLTKLKAAQREEVGHRDPCTTHFSLDEKEAKGGGRRR